MLAGYMTIAPLYWYANAEGFLSNIGFIASEGLVLITGSTGSDACGGGNVA